MNKILLCVLAFSLILTGCATHPKKMTYLGSDSFNGETVYLKRTSFVYYSRVGHVRGYQPSVIALTPEETATLRTLLGHATHTFYHPEYGIGIEWWLENVRDSFGTPITFGNMGGINGASLPENDATALAELIRNAAERFDDKGKAP